MTTILAQPARFKSAASAVTPTPRAELGSFEPMKYHEENLQLAREMNAVLARRRQRDTMRRLFWATVYGLGCLALGLMLGASVAARLAPRFLP